MAPKKRPPSYYRYRDSHPVISVVLTRGLKEELDKYRGELSYGKAIRRLLEEKAQEEMAYREKRKRFIEKLRKSDNDVGQLHPVIRTKYGIVEGLMRKEANLDWLEKFYEVNSLYGHYRIMANSNIQLEKPLEWWRDIVNKAAEELLKSGKDPEKGEILDQMIRDFGVDAEEIEMLLQKKYKPRLKRQIQ